jgi:hypothetical protein
MSLLTRCNQHFVEYQSSGKILVRDQINVAPIQDE